jgi:hypothetical protein
MRRLLPILIILTLSIICSSLIIAQSPPGAYSQGGGTLRGAVATNLVAYGDPSGNGAVTSSNDFFFQNGLLIVGNGTGGTGTIALTDNGAGHHPIRLTAGANSVDMNLSLPPTLPTAGQIMTVQSISSNSPVLQWSANLNQNSAIVNFNQAAQSQVVVSATEYYITRSDLDMPAAYTTAIGTGTTMKWRISLTKTAAGTGTFQILLKKGTNGSIADTSIVTQTIGTQTAAADNMEADIQLTWTSATAAYWTIVPHQSAATGTGFGLVYPAAAAQFSGTISGQTTTTASDKYGISLIFTTGTPTFVVNEVQAQAFGVN